MRVAQAKSLPAAQSAEPKHAPAVQRERGEEVEDEECQVDVAEPGDDAVDRLRRRREPGEEHEESAEHEGDDRSGDRDPELRARARKHALEPGHPSEEPERDAVDLHSLPACDERVPVLVHEQRDEEEECRRRSPCRGTCRRTVLGSCAGRSTRSSVQTISAKTTSQLQLTPTRIPAMRPSVKLSFTGLTG